MKKEIVFREVSADGSIVINGLKDFIGGNVKITIEKGSKRSLPQNKYLHGVIIPRVKECLLDLGWNDANSSEWVKDYIKYNCLIVESYNEQTGEVIKMLGSTANLSKSEFYEFKERVQQWASEKLGIYIPDPEEIIQE